jgi:Domain of unknown function (DUF4440)
MSELAQLERRRLQAIVGADLAVLEETHAPGFVLCTPSGTLMDRAQYLGRIVDGSVRYLRFEPDGPVESMQSASLGVVRYRSFIDISIDGREPGHLECWHLDVYELTGRGRWQCRWSQATDTIRD